MADNEALEYFDSILSSNYEGMVALLRYEEPFDNKVCLGLKQNVIGNDRYNNADNSLIELSDNIRIIDFLTPVDFEYSQKEMLEHGDFLEEDYIEYSRLQRGQLADYKQISATKFKGESFKEHLYYELDPSLISRANESSALGNMGEIVNNQYNAALAKIEQLPLSEREKMIATAKIYDFAKMQLDTQIIASSHSIAGPGKAASNISIDIQESIARASNALEGVVKEMEGKAQKQMSNNNMNGDVKMTNEIKENKDLKLATEQQMVFMSNLGLKFDMDITAEAASGMISEKLKKMEERAERLASPASEDQKKFMDKHGYEYSPEISNGEAIKAIRGIIADKKIEARKPATEKQLKFLVDRGIEFNDDIRKGEASYLIYKYEKEIEANRNLPATENQKQKLSKHKIEFDENITKGQAYDLIKDLKKHIETQRALPATEKQLELMEKRHLPITENMTRGEASNAIRQDNYKKFVITENQKKALEKYEIEIPENATKKDVSKLIGEAKKFEAITKYKDDPKRKLTANDFYKKEAQKQINTGCVLDDKKICKKMLMAGLSSNEVMTAIANNSPVNTFTRARDIVAQTAALPAVKKVVAQLDNARRR